MSRAQLTSTVEQNTGGAVAPVVAGKNAVANGAFDYWQRGNSFTPSNSPAYGADRWGVYTSGTTYTRQSSGLTGFNYCMQIQRNSGTSSTTSMYLYHSLETVESLRFAGQTVTFSFYAKAGANYSGTSNALTVQVGYGTGTDQNWASGFTGSTNFINSTATLTTSWQRFTFTGTVSSSATQLGFQFYETPTGTAGANDWYQITGVQLEIGSVATPFSRAGGTLQGELALCQRYYYRLAVGTSINFANGVALSGTVNCLDTYLPVTMRTNPTSLDINTIQLYDIAAGSFRSGGTFVIYVSTTNTAEIRYTHGSSVFTVNQVSLWSSSSSSGYIGFSAEL